MLAPQLAELTPDDLAVLAANPRMLQRGGQDEEMTDEEGVAMVIGALVLPVLGRRRRGSG